MKQLIIDLPDHVPETALIDFIAKSCHYYVYNLPTEEDQDYYEELMLIVNDLEWHNDLMDAVNKAHQQWQLNNNPWKSKNEPEW